LFPLTTDVRSSVADYGAALLSIPLSVRFQTAARRTQLGSGERAPRPHGRGEQGILDNGATGVKGSN